MLKKHQKPTEMAPKQARNTCSNMRHTRLDCVIYTTSVLTMHGVTKASKNNGMPQQKNHKYKLRYGQQKLNKDAQT